MKSKILKFKLLHFFILLSLIVSFNGCSDDDEPIPQTFLEKYDGTKWVNSDESTIYLRLNYNTNKPLEQWVSLSECYYYDFESGNLEIIENSENNLILKYTEEGITKIFTITILGKSLKIVLQENEEENIMYFQYTTVNVDDFEICDLGDFTYVPDDNFEQKLIELGYDDILDDYVLTENINDVVELDVNRLEIKNLTGIKDFESLKILNCNRNKLTSLDVSKNTSLETLRCYFNQLTNLDVSYNIFLELLECDGNELTGLDISNNTSLIELYCTSNQLTSLNVSNKKNLKYLYCDENQLTSLDVSNNTSLGIISCSGNQLTSLDVSNNTSLSIISCSYNQLTSLDVSNNTHLNYLVCHNNQLTSLDVSNNTFLYYLSCSKNQLTSLDVRNNISLGWLFCSDNQLTSLDITNNTSLEELDCSTNQLTSLDVSYNTILSSLECNSNQISCIKVNESQLNNDVSNWTKDDSSTWSLDCD